MTIYQSIGQAWATLFGFEKEGNEILFNGKPTYYYNNPITDWETLLDAKPSEIKSIAQVAESPSTRTYAELMQPENFSYSAFNWTNEHGTRLGFSLGDLRVDQLTENFNIYLTFLDTGVTVTVFTDDVTPDAYVNHGLGFTPNSENASQVKIDLDLYDSLLSSDTVTNGDVNDIYFAFYITKNSDVLAWVYDNSLDGSYVAYNNGQGWNILDISTVNISDYFSNQIFVYFDDGAHLPEGIEWNETLESYFVPTIADVSTAELVTSQASLAMQGANIMTHCTLWAGGVTMMVFIYSIFAFIKHCFARR